MPKGENAHALSEGAGAAGQCLQAIPWILVRVLAPGP